MHKLHAALPIIIACQRMHILENLDPVWSGLHSQGATIGPNNG